MASQQLESAAFTTSVTMDRTEAGRETQLEGTIAGRTQDGGNELALTIDADMTVTADGETKEYGLTGDVMVLDEGKVLVRLTNMEGDQPMYTNPFAIGLINQWVQLPMAGSGTDTVRDARLLRMQTEVLRVTNEKGIEKIAGRDAYRYDVAIDEAKMLAFLEQVARQRGEQPAKDEWNEMLETYDATGEAWIDAETFHVLRLTWHIVSKDAAAPMTLDISTDIGEHNRAEPIVPPTNVKLPPANAQELMMFLPGATPVLPQTPASELSPEMQEEILRSLLENN